MHINNKKSIASVQTITNELVIPNIIIIIESVSHLCVQGGGDPLGVLATDLVDDAVHLITDIANLTVPRWKNLLLCSKKKRLEHYRSCIWREGRGDMR